jgi:putative acetyltransferase
VDSVTRPWAVRKEGQDERRGGSLIHEILRLAEDAGEPAVMVEGVPAYYPRFGFQRASSLGFVSPSP